MQTLTEDKRNRLATVYKILQIWNIGGLKAVEIFLNDKNTIVEKISWGSRIKEKIKIKRYDNVQFELEKLIQKFKISEYEFTSNKTKGFNYDSSNGGWS